MPPRLIWCCEEAVLWLRALERVAGKAVSAKHVGIAEQGMHASPVRVEVKKAISWRSSASKRLVLILTFSFVIATVKSPPLMPVVQSSARHPIHSHAHRDGNGSLSVLLQWDTKQAHL